MKLKPLHYIPHEHRKEMWEWCEKMNITIQYEGIDMWYLPDEKHRAWFELRWS